MTRHSELLAYADQRDTDAATARANRDAAPRGSFERGMYAQQAEDATGDAFTLRAQAADEKWRATR